MPLSSKGSSVYCLLGSLGTPFAWGGAASRVLWHAFGVFVALNFTGPILNIKYYLLLLMKSLIEIY